MIKNTEWGAVAILTASDYGAGSSINNSQTSTGNASGIYTLVGRKTTGTYPNYYDYEYTAGVLEGATASMGVLSTANGRYVNKYEAETAVIDGDGREYGSAKLTTSNPVTVRGGTINNNAGSLSLFGSEVYTGASSYHYGKVYSGYNDFYYYFYSRGCLVVGAGL